MEEARDQLPPLLDEASDQDSDEDSDDGSVCVNPDVDEDVEEVIRFIESNPQRFMQDYYCAQAKRKRKRRPKVDLDQSEWGRLINSHSVWDANSFEDKKFILRFRVPFKLFKLKIVPAYRAEGIFNSTRKK